MIDEIAELLGYEDGMEGRGGGGGGEEKTSVGIGRMI